MLISKGRAGEFKITDY